MLSLGSDWCPKHLKGRKRGFYKPKQQKRGVAAAAASRVVSAVAPPPSYSVAAEEIWEASRLPVIEVKGPEVKKGSRRTQNLSKPKYKPATRNTNTPPVYGKKVRRKKRIVLPPCENSLTASALPSWGNNSQSEPHSVAFSSTFSTPQKTKSTRGLSFISDSSHLLTPTRGLNIESMDAFKTAALLKEFGARKETKIYQVP
jgi:hypothetical protein